MEMSDLLSDFDLHLSPPRKRKHKKSSEFITLMRKLFRKKPSIHQKEINDYIQKFSLDKKLEFRRSYLQRKINSLKNELTELEGILAIRDEGVRLQQDPPPYGEYTPEGGPVNLEDVPQDEDRDEEEEEEEIDPTSLLSSGSAAKFDTFGKHSPGDGTFLDKDRYEWNKLSDSDLLTSSRKLGEDGSFDITDTMMVNAGLPSETEREDDTGRAILGGSFPIDSPRKEDDNIIIKFPLKRLKQDNEKDKGTLFELDDFAPQEEKPGSVSMTCSNSNKEWSQISNESSQNDDLKKRRSKRKPYKMRSEEFKQRAILDAQREGIKTASRRHGVETKTLKRWVEVGAKRRKGGGRKTMDPEMESNLYSWYKSMHVVGNPVTANMVKLKAVELSNCPEFVASKGWFEKFKARYNLDIKREKRARVVPGSPEAEDLLKSSPVISSLQQDLLTPTVKKQKTNSEQKLTVVEKLALSAAGLHIDKEDKIGPSGEVEDKENRRSSTRNQQQQQTNRDEEDRHGFHGESLIRVKFSPRSSLTVEGGGSSQKSTRADFDQVTGGSSSKRRSGGRRASRRASKGGGRGEEEEVEKRDDQAAGDGFLTITHIHPDSHDEKDSHFPAMRRSTRVRAAAARKIITPERFLEDDSDVFLTNNSLSSAEIDNDDDYEDEV